MKSKNRGFTLFELTQVILVLFFFIGWIMNIVDIVKAGPIEFTGVMICRVVGIFIVPLGSIMGWFF